VTYTWVRKRQRKRVPYENPEGRRVNALAALLRTADGTDLVWTTKPKAFVADEVVQFLHDLPPVAVPTVVVLDNVGVHRSKVVRAALPDLWARRIYLYYLPPYSPELNAIEPRFRVIKHDDLPQRRSATVAALTAAIEIGFANDRARLHGKSQVQPRRAA
jgi:transposase